MNATKPHPTETSAYWRNLAREQRIFAEQKRTNRAGTVESIRVHLQNATDYDATAAKLEGQGK